ncbi:MAG: HNH endonuclease [Pseudomonas fluorescens]
MRIENGYLLSAWQDNNEVPPKKIYPYLLKKKGATEKTFDVSMSGRSYRGSYIAVQADDFIAGLLDGRFPEPATVRMKVLNTKGSPGNGWLIRNLKLDPEFVASEDTVLPSQAVPLDDVNSKFEALMSEAKLLSFTELERKSKVFPRQPKKIWVTTLAYQRNPYVVVRALQRANGVCENCDSIAPFFRKSDGTPYLEVHHKTPLAQGGDDTFENAIALCPNCHRRMHFGRAI